MIYVFRIYKKYPIGFWVILGHFGSFWVIFVHFGSFLAILVH